MTSAKSGDLVSKRKPRRQQQPFSLDAIAMRNAPPLSIDHYRLPEENNGSEPMKARSASKFYDGTMKTYLQAPPNVSRVQEVESDDSSKELVIEVETQGSMDSKCTAPTSTSGTGYDSTSIASDSGTEASSVAHLRHWLDEFGQKQKKHVELSSSVGPTSSDPLRATKMNIPKTKPIVPPTPIRPTPAAVLQRKLEPSVPRARSTPVRIKVVHSNVEATNEGYKPVAQLAAWLADDPTKPKKEIKVLRRGANVISKSRPFDKGLANVIIEQHSIRAGSVLRERRRLEAESDDHNSEKMEITTSVSVSDKKQWLAGAFKKSDFTDDKARTELVTEQEMHDDLATRAKQLWRERSETTASSSSKAKQLWRERAAAEKRFPQRSPIGQRKDGQLLSPSNPGARAYETRFHASNNYKESSQLFSPSDPGGSKRVNAPCLDQYSSYKQSREKENNTGRESKAEDEPEVFRSKTKEESQETAVGFSEARKLLVQRSKQNGHDAYVLSKVGLKKAKFEKIEMENRKQTSFPGHLKAKSPASASSQTTESLPRSAYVRSYLPHPATKKSFDKRP